MRLSSLSVLGIIAAQSLATAQETFDVSGMQSWGLDGDFDNETMSFFPTQGAPFNVILEIAYDLNIQTLGNSLLSDVSVRFGNSTGTFDGGWPDVFNPGFAHDLSGRKRFVGSFLTDFQLNADGELRFSLFELSDDNPNAVDAVFLPGSTITVSYFIPSPSSAVLLGMGGLLAVRRRR